MKILAISAFLPGATDEKLQPLMKDEMETAWKNYADGVVRDWYFRQDRPGAVMVMECASVDEAKKVCDALPLAKAGLIGFEYIPLGPFLPIAALFTNQ